MINHKKSFILILGTLAFSLFGFSSVLAESFSSDNVSVSVPVSCSITRTINTVHSATVDPGTYEDEIGESTFNVLCNDYEGFAVYAIGYSGDSYGDNTMIPNNINSSYSIASGTATSGNTSNWAMKLTAVSGDFAPTLATGFNAYHAVPDEYTKVASLAANTDATNGSSFKSTYAIYVANGHPADTYVGKVKYTVVHPASTSAPLICRPNGTTIATISCMQDISSTNKSSILTSMTTNSYYSLIDKRDGKEYLVAKLDDGNIWMTQNLDLDIDSNVTYTNLDTDIGYNTSTGQYETASWKPMRSTYTSDQTQFCVDTSTSCYNGPVLTAESYDPGDIYWNGTLNDDIENIISDTGDPHFHIGNYYNSAASVATNNINELVQGNVDDFVEINQSICPAGWRLPEGLGNYDNPPNGSIFYLASFYGWEGIHTQLDNPYIYNSPARLILSGMYNGDGISDDIWIGTDGWYSDSTFYQAGDHFEEAYGTYITTDNRIATADQGPMGFGRSVRCLVR